MTHCTLGLLMTLALGCPWSTLAAAVPAPTSVPRIGLLLTGGPPGPPHLLDAFRQGLRELGWVEGQNLAIEYRWAGEQPGRLRELAADLVRLPVDILIAVEPLGARAAQQATVTLPIVVLGVGDAVGRGLVKSLARPGGNITGLSEQYAEISHKWLELLKEAVPQASRVGALTLPRWWPVQGEAWTALQQTATTMSVTLQRVEVRGPSDFEPAFARMAQEHVEALVMLPHPFFFGHRRRLVALAAERHLPTLWGPFREFVDAGGLMAYGPSLRHQFQRAAYFVDKILKGAKPADLPVEQPTTFELIINLKTAQALGLSLPASLLFQADEVIR